MKIATSFLAGLLVIGSLGAVNSAIAEDVVIAEQEFTVIAEPEFPTAIAADGILSKDELTPDSYCHEKFAAMRPSTLSDDQPTLKGSSTGDVIDFYGPCDENPVGTDQVQAQKLENEHRREMGRE